MLYPNISIIRDYRIIEYERRMVMSSIAQVTPMTSDTFQQEVLNSALPVLVDFWAPWCGPCRMVAPIVEAVANQLSGEVKVVKLNVDEHPDIASQYGIRSIPTLTVFNGGQVVDTVVGVVPQATLISTLAKYL
jgi:thioredoxin 1